MQCSILLEVFLEADVVAEEALVEPTKVVGIIGVGMTILLAEVTGKDAYLVKQVDGTKRCVDVCTDENNGLMARQAFEEIVTHFFLTRCDQQNECAFRLWAMLALDAIGECKETAVALVTIVGDNA